MNVLRSLPGFAALLLPLFAAAQTPSKPALSAADKAALEQEHKLAVVTVKFGGTVSQIMFELFEKDAPKTVANFIENTNKGFYNGLAVHRTIADYLVQTGDGASRTNDNRDQWGLSQEYTIPGEFKRPHISGSVAMARRGDKVNPKKESDGTQFYFAVGNLSNLNGQYTVFGQVVSGMSSLKRISRALHDSNDMPLERIEIVSVKVIDHKGPLANLKDSDTDGDNSKRRGSAKPDALKNPFEKLLDRVW